jgi:hypothetical protein
MNTGFSYRAKETRHTFRETDLRVLEANSQKKSSDTQRTRTGSVLSEWLRVANPPKVDRNRYRNGSPGQDLKEGRNARIGVTFSCHQKEKGNSQEYGIQYWFESQLESYLQAQNSSVPKNIGDPALPRSCQRWKKINEINMNYELNGKRAADCVDR